MAANDIGARQPLDLENRPERCVLDTRRCGVERVERVLLTIRLDAMCSRGQRDRRDDDSETGEHGLLNGHATRLPMRPVPSECERIRL